MSLPRCEKAQRRRANAAHIHLVYNPLRVYIEQYCTHVGGLTVPLYRTLEMKEPDSLDITPKLAISGPGRAPAARGRRVAVTWEHQLPGLQPPAVALVGRNSIALSFASHVVIMLRVAHSLSLHYLTTFWILDRASSYSRPTLASGGSSGPFVQLTATTCSRSHVMLVAMINRGVGGQCDATKSY
jgi:hypothetical protein